MIYNTVPNTVKMTISIRLSQAESDLIRPYAEMKGMTISELMKQTVLERIEDELDIKLFEEAYGDFNKNPRTYTIDEAERELELR